VAASSESFDPLLEEQLTNARTRRFGDLRGREAIGRAAMLLIYVAAAAAFNLVTTSSKDAYWPVEVAFCAAYAAVSLVEFEVGNGVALPTELVLVPMLFALPAPHVPLVVGAALLLSGLVSAARGRTTVARAALYPANALFALGPALVFAAAGEPPPDWLGAAVLTAALVAQFVADFAASATAEYLAFGTAPGQLLRPMTLAFLIDALIAPVAYVIAIANAAQPGAILLPVPLVILLALFARERRQKLDSTLELSSAYRGTAFLLGDVVEADDAYTGDHSRQVVDLVSAVGTKLGLSRRDLRVAEFAALLHDIGKIRIPSTIINKPGPLDADEWRLMQTHTIEGEALLQRVGGLLADVGAIVRSCHERWDGQGYPDGLAGTEIPLIARIVCCCDAYNAMTTDRPYRKALPVSAALAELRANAGAQFDPDVVESLVAVQAQNASTPPAAEVDAAAVGASASVL
jgi:HD-GYP domain-containing protein (c-di-GMP phosphodiesterase class II)